MMNVQTDKMQETMALAKANGEANGEPFPTQVDRSKGDGVTTCLFHRSWEWSLKYYAPLMPLCTFCGGRCDPRLTAHELCKSLASRQLPTPKLDSFSFCSCAKCEAAAKASN
jgi:hypothetical protein